MRQANLNGLELIDLEEKHIPEILAFADTYIGPRYYNPSSLKEILNLAQMNKSSICLGLKDSSNHKLVALRISLPPGGWIQKYCEGILSDQWPLDPKDVGYFKSLFLSPEFRGRGLGPYLSQVAIERMKTRGAKGIAVHSWKESPHNASLRYLSKIGFKAVGEIPLYWNRVDYDCTGCKTTPCTCTAVEMILDIDKAAKLS